jgi:hypothetical protein
MKKTKSFNDTATPPISTGFQSSPGMGNLFAKPRPINEEWPDLDIDPSDPFSSPSPSKPVRTFRRTRTLDSMPLNAHVLFGQSRVISSAMDKENLDPGLNNGRRVIDISATPA